MNGAMIACLPNKLGYNPSQTLMYVGDSRKISCKDYHDLGLKDKFVAFEIWKDLYEPYLDMLMQPIPIHTHIVRTDHLDTPDSYFLKTLDDYPSRMEYTSGDGVVPNRSLLAYKKLLIPNMTRDMVVPFSDHTG